MKIPIKRLKSHFSLPVLGIGTWKMGGWPLRDPFNDDKKDIRAIQTALDLGITHIDTAEIYAWGYAEKLVAEAISDFNRKKIFLVSKIFPQHLSYSGVISACKGSLKRLKTNYLDLYLIHWPNPLFPLRQTLRAFDDLKKQGLILNIGVSNFSAREFMEAQSYTQNKIVTNQIHYNLVSREPDNQEALEYAQDNDFLVTAYSPLEEGRIPKMENKILDEICQKYGKSRAQIALNWLISQDNVVTIVKASNIEHLEEDLGSLGWEMEKEDIKRLNDL